MANEREKTPIELVLKIDENGMTTASAVYEWLGLHPSNYAKWCRVNIVENNYFIEGVDYWEIAENGLFVLSMKNAEDPEAAENGDSKLIIKKGRPKTDYKITSEMAKMLCLMARNERGREAYRYFIKSEEALKKVAMNAIVEIKKIQALQAELENKLSLLEEKQYQDKVNIAYLQMGALDYQPSSWYFEIWKHLDYYRNLQATYECRCDTLSKLIGKVIHNAQIKDEINYTKRKMIEDFGIDSPEKVGVMQVIDYDRGLRTSFHDALNRMIHKYEHAYDMGEYHDWMDDYLPPVEKW